MVKLDQNTPESIRVRERVTSLEHFINALNSKMAAEGSKEYCPFPFLLQNIGAMVEVLLHGENVGLSGADRR